MRKVVKRDPQKNPYSLYVVERSEENTHANATFIFCARGPMFAVTNDGYCSAGDLLLAEWQENGDLRGLSKAEVLGKNVVAGRCIKGVPGKMSVPLTGVDDRR